MHTLVAVLNIHPNRLVPVPCVGTVDGVLIGHDDSHPLQGETEHAGQVGSDHEGVLRRGPDGDALGAVLRDGRVGFQGVVVHQGEVKCILEDSVRLGKARLDIAPLVMILVAQV